MSVVAVVVVVVVVGDGGGGGGGVDRPFLTSAATVNLTWTERICFVLVCRVVVDRPFLTSARVTRL